MKNIGKVIDKYNKKVEIFKVVKGFIPHCFKIQAGQNNWQKQTDGRSGKWS